MVALRLIIVVSLLSLPVTASGAVPFGGPIAIASFDSGGDQASSVDTLVSESEQVPVAATLGGVETTASYTTSPVVSTSTWKDTDEDGLDDRLESSLGTDTASADTDADGLDDWSEVLRHETDPLDADTDGDSVLDGTEHRLGLQPTVSEVDGFSPDTDRDGLVDALERRIGTDPTNVDTDGDGLSDGAEVYGAPRHFPGADPLRKDVYFEVDAFHTVTVNQTALDRTADFFASAPIENPDGTTGLRVHFVVDETDLRTLDAANVKDHSTVVADFDRRNRGYQYIFLTEDVFIGDHRVRASANFGRVAMAGSEQSDRLLVHEIGHLLGVHGSDGPGVDSYETTLDEYPSIMSYTYLNSNEEVRMADGSESPKSNDDWDDIERRFTRWVDTSTLDAEVSVPETHSGKSTTVVADRHPREEDVAAGRARVVHIHP
jgi:hypothetical protein